MLAAPSSETDESLEAREDSSRPPRGAGSKYYVLAELGRGGTATVYLAVARGHGGVRKLVVLKALLPEFAQETSAMTSFLDEARLAVQLNHPNVVQTYEVGTEAGHTVIVMEYLEGQSLSRITRACEATGRRLPDGMHLKILIELLAGLHYSHEVRSYEGRPLDLVHRDVSPQNVFVTYDGQVKVLDFGIAKARTSLTHTAHGVLKGKISYMAPEQMAGGTVDRRADIFSVGCMLWAAAAGRKLWKDYSYVQIVRMVLAGKLPSPKQINPYCPEELERIVMKALAPERDDRYSTALELQEALEAFTEKTGLGVKQREIGAFVSELFATTRAELKANVERELATVLASEPPATEPPPSDAVEFGPEEIQLVSGASSQVRELSARGGTARRRSGAFAFATALAVGLGASLLAFRYTRVRDASPPPPLALDAKASTPAAPSGVAPPAAPPPASAAPTAPSTARLMLEIVPPDARLALDGQPLPRGARELSLPVSDTLHQLTADADGHEQAMLEFRVVGPDILRLSLKPKAPSRGKANGALRAARGGRSGSNAPKVAAPAPSATVAAETAAAPEPPPSPRDPACDKPFILDANGIKVARPECM